MLVHTIVNICIYLIIIMIIISIILALLAHFDISAYIYITYILWMVALFVFYLILPKSTYNFLNI